MKKSQKGNIETKATVLLAAIIIALCLILESCTCSSRWSKSGMMTSWGPVQGCLVKTEGNKWIPEDRVREVDVKGN